MRQEDSGSRGFGSCQLQQSSAGPAEDGRELQRDHRDSQIAEGVGATQDRRDNLCHGLREVDRSTNPGQGSELYFGGRGKPVPSAGRHARLVQMLLSETTAEEVDCGQGWMGTHLCRQLG